MRYEDWQRAMLLEFHKSRENPVACRMHGVRFVSSSRGRGRRRRPRLITLVYFGTRWRAWSGEDRQDGGRVPWDQWATELGLDTAQAARDLFESLIKGGRF